MRLDKYSRPIFDEQDIFNALYNGDSIDSLICENSADIQAFNNYSTNKLTVYQDLEINIEDFDKIHQKNWLMPEEYKSLDIEGFLVHVCPKQHYQRLIDELVEFRERNLLDLLRWLKYFVDTCRNNKIVWGVGRGSSVSSYVLFLIGVHKIDSIKYNLDYKEFLR